MSKDIHLCDNELIHLNANNRKISILKDSENNEFRIFEHKENDKVKTLLKFKTLNEYNDVITTIKDKNAFNEINDSLDKATKKLQNELKVKKTRKNKI